MHVRQLVELAALVAVHAPVLIRSGRISESALEQYWESSKARLDAWGRMLNDYFESQHPQAPNVLGEALQVVAWQCIRPVVEEILAAEVLTRVWSGVALAHDRQHGSQQIEPVLRSVYAGHLEARNRALNVLVHGRGFSTQEAVELNRLRRRCERWCDMLLGYVVTDPSVAEFAFERERTREFAQDILDELNQPLSPFGWQLVLSSLRAAFQQGLSDDSPNPALNQQISASILSCFHGELFDSTGLLRSLWMERISHMTSDTEGMIAELLSLDDPPSGRIVPSRTRH